MNRFAVVYEERHERYAEYERGYFSAPFQTCKTD